MRSSGKLPESQPAQDTTSGRLLDTAARLFWENGFAATTTRQIAATLGIQQASLYYHVKNKEDLLYQIFTSSIENFTQKLSGALEGVKDPGKRVRILCVAHMEQLLKYQKRNATMITEMRSLTGSHRRSVVELRRKYAGMVGSILEQAQAAGALRSDIHPRYLNLTLLNLLNWVCLWYRTEEDPPPTELGAMYGDLFLEGALTRRGRQSLSKSGLTAESFLQRTSGKKPDQPESTSIRMLKAAAALFAQKGYYLAKTREIAEQLGIRKASLYYHVDAKEDLLFAICKASIERIQHDVGCALTSTADPLERLRRVIPAHVACVLRDHDMHTTALADVNALSPKRRNQVRAERDAYEALLESVLAEGQRAGYLRTDIDVKYLKLGLLGLMDRVQMWYRPGGELSPEQIAGLISTVFLQGANAVTSSGTTRGKGSRTGAKPKRPVV